MLAESLLSSRERLRIVELLFFEQTVALKVRQLAKATKASPSLVSNVFSILKKEKVAKNGKLDYLHPLVKSLKIMLNIEKLNAIGLAKEAIALFSDCKGIGVYGSWANGTNFKDSDLDLWIKTEKGNDEKILGLRRLLKKKAKVEANILLLNENQLKKIREKDFAFYCSLASSFVLWGEGI